MTPAQQQAIKTIKAQITALEKQLPTIVEDKNKRANWVTDITNLKSQIDMVERQKTITVNKVKQTTFDYKAFK